MASMPAAWKAALCIAGDAEWAIGEPATPYTTVDALTERTRYIWFIAETETCPGAAPVSPP